jgi:hypothetical protein
MPLLPQTKAHGGKFPQALRLSRLAGMQTQASGSPAGLQHFQAGLEVSGCPENLGTSQPWRTVG